MKKLFAFFAAVLMSTSLFSTPASVPTVADVTSAGFDVTNARVIVLYFDEQVCNDIVWAGSYNEWVTAPEDMLQFEPLEGFAGWYVLELFDSSDPCQGRPVQLKKDGSFSWDFQTGDPDAWINMAQPGTQTASIEYGYTGESDITLFNLGVYIYEVAYFKFHNTPCGVEPTPITVNAVVPAGTPACYFYGEMSGNTFVEMTKLDDTHYTIDFPDATTIGWGYRFVWEVGNWSTANSDPEGDFRVEPVNSVIDVEVRAWATAPAPTPIVPELTAPQVPTVSDANVRAISCDKYDSDLGWYAQGWGGCNWVDTCKAGVNMFYAKTMHWDCFASDWVSGAGVADYANLHFDIWFETDGNSPIIKLEFVDELPTEEITIPGEYKAGWNSVNINIKEVYGEQPMDNLKCLTVKVAKEGEAVAWANILFFNGDYTSQEATGYCGDAPAECKYTEYENWQIKPEGSDWSDNLIKVEDGLFKLVDVNWTGSGFNVKSDENPIKQDWFAPEELTVGEEVIAPVIVDIYLRVIDDETMAIGVGVDPTVSTDVINVINAEDVPNGAIIKDGKVYIIRNGKVYNLQGSEIKNADQILKSVNF